MKKAILLPMLCLITLCGCEKSTELSEITGNTGNSENPETETPENGSLTFQLHTDKTTCNLLDLTIFSISFNRTVSMLDISNQFDSIAWIVEDKDKNLHSFCIMEQNKNFFQWSHCFYYPGEYKTYLAGYKNQKETFRSDTLDLQVVTKDFLGWKWNEFPDETGQTGTGTVNMFNSDFELTYYNQLSDNGVPGWNLYVFNSAGEDEQAFYEKSSEALYHYITQIYGAPSIDRNSPELTEAFTTDFDYHPDYATPLAIWKTEQTRIVQLRIDKNWPTARIYAEPLSEK